MMKSYNPANGELVWEGIADSSNEIANKIVQGSKAFSSWSTKSIEERIEFLTRYENELKKNKDNLALAISKETGKPLWESKTEVDAMISKIPLSIQSFLERCGRKESTQGNFKLFTEYRPHGVVAVFGPFNFPGHLPNGHIVPALLAGNVVLFKPSELTPFVGELIHKYLKLPDGVFQVVQGGPDAGKTLANSLDVKGIFFTGSAAIGEILKEQNLKNPGRILALEMGGNNPLIISKIQDVKAAAYLTIQSAFLTTGQRCSAARRLILTDECPKDAFIKELVHQVEGLKIGSYDDKEEPFMGPVIHLNTAKKLLDAEKHLIKQGATVIYPMRQLYVGLPFITPALIDVTSILSTRDEELFGPFLQIYQTDSLDNAIKIANDTAYGLSSGLFSESEMEWKHFYSTIRAGIINWNAPLTGASSKAPFGGIGKSGNYRPSAYLAADYCSYPIASMQKPALEMPLTLTPGISP